MFIQTLPPEHTLIPNAQYKSYINEKSLWARWTEGGGGRWNKYMSSQENHVMLYNIVFIKRALSGIILHYADLIMSKLIAVAVILQD